MPAHGATIFSQPDLISVTYSADENAANLFTKAGSPSGVVSVTCTINSGVTLGSTSVATPAFLIPSNFAVGSTISLINNGKIHGMGGHGGAGAANGGNTGVSGQDGGTAIEAHRALTITNASGEIFAGGAGGKGGNTQASSVFGGGGGGGGQGHGTSAGGSGGPGLVNGTVGDTGNASGPGSGGGPGGSGASAGNTGKAWGLGTTVAIAMNGFTLTWVSGNDSTHLKGPVT